MEDGTGFEPDLKYRCPEYPASGDDDGALALHVSLPMHDLKVVSAVDLKYDDLTIGQIPLSIQIPPQTGGILPSALPSRRGQAELPAEVRQINLTKRFGTCGNVGNRQPQICLMANATNRAHRRIQPCSRSDPLLDSCCDHQTREAWIGLPCRSVKNRARRVGTRKSMGTHNVLQSQSSRFVYANAGHWCHAGATLDN